MSKVFSSQNGQDLNNDPTPHRVITSIHKQPHKIIYAGDKRVPESWVGGEEDNWAFTMYDPRSEYDYPLKNPTNFILQTFREYVHSTNLPVKIAAKEWLEPYDLHQWMESFPMDMGISEGLDMLLHAYKVITRLATFTSNQ